MQIKRYRSFTVMYSYDFDTHDSEGQSRNPAPTVFSHVPAEKEWREWRKTWLTQKVNTKSGEYFGIFHDKDLKDDGKLKPLHMHAVVMLKNPMSEDAFRRYFEVSRPENAEHTVSINGALRYLLHITDQAIADFKHIYSESDLFGHAQGFLDRDKRSLSVVYHYKISDARNGRSGGKAATPKRVKALTNKLGGMLYRGEITMQEATELYEKEFGDTGTLPFKNVEPALKKQWQAYLSKKADEFRINGRHLVTDFITGQGGTGKSNLAEAIAYYADPSHSWHATTGPGKGKTSDITDGYAGEPQAIINELDGDAESFRALCALLDPYHFSKSSSRNQNTDYLVDRIHITTSTDLSNWLIDSICQTKRYWAFGEKLRKLNLMPWELLQLTAQQGWLADDTQTIFDYLIKACSESNSDYDTVAKELQVFQEDAWQLIRRLPYTLEVFSGSDLGIFKGRARLTKKQAIDSFTLSQRVKTVKPLDEITEYFNHHTFNKVPTGNILEANTRFLMLSETDHLVKRSVTGSADGMKEIAENAQKYNLAWSEFPLFADSESKGQTSDAIVVLSKLDETLRRYNSLVGFGIKDITSKEDCRRVGFYIAKAMGIYRQNKNEKK